MTTLKACTGLEKKKIFINYLRKQMIVRDYIGEMLPGENSYTNRGMRWDASTLITAAKDLPTFDLSLMSIDLDRYPWRFENWNFKSFLWHTVRIEKTNLKYPVILDEYGSIIDGWHRIAKAILQGKETIKAVRFKVMPEADEILKEE